MLNFDPQRQTAAFKVEGFPFTMWLWVGGLFLILGVSIAVWPEEDTLTGRYRQLRRVGNLANIGIVALAFSLPLAVLGDATWSHAQSEPQSARAAAQGTASAEDSPTAGEDGQQQPAHLADTRVPTDIESFLAQEVNLTSEERKRVERLSSMVMTTCEGCAGKTLTLASPSCVPSSIDKQRIRGMISSGLSDREVLDRFVEDRGENALAIPQDSQQQRIAWILPGGILAVGLGLALVVVLKRRNDSPDNDDRESTEYSFDENDPYLKKLREDVAAGEG
jgi:cytochrome c-type biogenesis protein CcmH/NrfF